MSGASTDLSFRTPGEPATCRVVVGACPEWPVPADALAVVDERVARLHPGRLPQVPTLAIEGGEGAKTVLGVERLWRFFAEHGADRGTPIVGIGGGTLTDLVGFAASTWLRGAPFGFVATTLMAQVDAALGGKNGINFLGFKNQVGCITPPAYVVCDASLLPTLPASEYVSGLAEVVKYALIASPSLFDLLESRTPAVLSRDGDLLARIVRECVAIKAAIVERDPFERGDRRLLNLGHTLGHGYEAALGVPHGVAVAAGLVDACELSVARGWLDPHTPERVRHLLAALGLPARLSAPAERLEKALLRDKKRRGGTLHLVLLRGVGEAVVSPTPVDEVAAFIRARGDGAS